MCRKLIYLISFVFVLGLAAGIANAELVGYWKFDEGSGNTAYDLSNYTNNGTINGDPKWVAGKIGAALEFDGSDDYVWLCASSITVLVIRRLRVLPVRDMTHNFRLASGHSDITFKLTRVADQRKQRLNYRTL